MVGIFSVFYACHEDEIAPQKREDFNQKLSAEEKFPAFVIYDSIRKESSKKARGAVNLDKEMKDAFVQEMANIHEIFHAVFSQYLWENYPIKESQLNREYLHNLLNNDAILFNEFKNLDANGQEHNLMAYEYMEAMKWALRDIYPKLTADEAEAFFWGALKETKLYKEKMKEDPDFYKKLNKKINKAYEKYPDKCFSF